MNYIFVTAEINNLGASYFNPLRHKIDIRLVPYFYLFIYSKQTAIQNLLIPIKHIFAIEEKSNFAKVTVSKIRKRLSNAYAKIFSLIFFWIFGETCTVISNGNHSKEEEI